MNIDEMHKLADLMEVIEPEAFDMGVWWTPSDENICGTAGCLAGWVVYTNEETQADALAWRTADREQRLALLHKYVPGMGYVASFLHLDHFPYPHAGARRLGLDREDASRLFESDSWWMEKMMNLGLINEDDECCDLEDITSKQAAVVVRALANGEIGFAYEDEA